MLTAALAALCSVAHAKLPPASDEAKAKAAEAAAKTAWNGKSDAYLMCKSQDKVAAAYFKSAKAAGKETKQPATLPPCADPGPYSFTVTEKKPIEASGAHSPAGNATSPPSTNATSSALNPKK
ncbi:MAG: hypothetical protein H7332_09255 [Bdellovibrionales bacterium]|nr:hypothetical protein [Ramlibacter sp.]